LTTMAKQPFRELVNAARLLASLRLNQTSRVILCIPLALHLYRMAKWLPRLLPCKHGIQLAAHAIERTHRAGLWLTSALEQSSLELHFSAKTKMKMPTSIVRIFAPCTGAFTDCRIRWEAKVDNPVQADQLWPSRRRLVLMFQG